MFGPLITRIVEVAELAGGRRSQRKEFMIVKEKQSANEYDKKGARGKSALDVYTPMAYCPTTYAQNSNFNEFYTFSC